MSDDDLIPTLPGIAGDLTGDHVRDNGQILEDAVDLDAFGQLGHIANILSRIVGMRMQLLDGDVSNCAFCGLSRRLVIVLDASEVGFVLLLIGFPLGFVAPFLLVWDGTILADAVVGVIVTLQLAEFVFAFALAFVLQRAAVIQIFLCHELLLSCAELFPSAGTVYYFRLMPFTRHQCRWACFFLAMRQAAQKRFSLRS